MSVGTLTPPRNATRNQDRWRSARAALAQAYAKTVRTVSAARHRNWSPALTVSGLGCIDAAFYQLGLFAGLVATGISILLFDWSHERTR